MYTATVNGKQLDLGDVQISMTLKNPMFDPNMGMESTASFPFKLPNTPKNMAALGFPARLSKEMPWQIDFDFEHRFGAIRLPGTQLRILKVSEKEIEAYIKIGRSEFLSVTKDKTLRDLAFEEETLVDHATPDVDQNEIKKWLLSTTPMEYSAAFPMVKNLGLFGASEFTTPWWDGSGAGPYQNCYSLAGKHWADAIHNTPDYGRIPAVSPMPWLVTVLNKIFQEASIQILSNEFASNPVLKRLCIYNPVIVKFYNQGIDRQMKFHLNNHLPKITIATFLSALRVPFGIDTYFHHIRKEVRLVSRDSIITSTDPPVEFSDKVSRARVTFLEIPALNYTFSMKSDDNDNLWQQTMMMSKTQTLSDPGSVMYFPMLPSDQPLNSVCLVINENWWYVFKEDENLLGTYLWVRFSYNFQDAIIGTGDMKFEAPIAPLVTLSEVPFCHDGDMGEIVLPAVELLGNNQNNPIYPGLELSDFTLRLLFYHGLKADGVDNTYYPYATSLFPTVYATPGPQTFDMSWRSPEEITAFPQFGLYQNFWKNWVEWRKKTTQVEIEKNMTPMELANLDFTKKYKINESQFILDELNFTVSLNSIQPAKIKAWTV